MSGRVLLRALLTALAFVVLVPVALVVEAGFLPNFTPIPRLDDELNIGLAWILLAGGAATVAILFAVALGGRRFTLVLLAAALVVMGGAGIVAYRYVAFAHDQNASYDIGRSMATPPGNLVADATFTYATTDPGVQLHAELWRAPSGSPNRGPNGRAAIVYIHGGGFVAGGLHNLPNFFASLAAAGYPVFDVEYRLAPPPRWADAPGDVLCGLVFLSTIAATEDIDPTRVAVMGDSAGGSLALLAGFAGGTDRLPSSCPGTSIAPAAVIGVEPAADLAGIWQDDTFESAGLRFPEAYVGGTPDQFPDRYAMASPFRLIRAGLPPTLLIAAENDHLIPRPRVTEIVDALTAAGDTAQLVVIPYAEHGYDEQANGYGAQVELSITLAFMAQVTG